jgi:hypothetical protein
MPYDPVGSGSPYYGSGFVNFDRYLNEPNIGWGFNVLKEDIEQPKSEEYWQQTPEFDEWITNRAGAERGQELTDYKSAWDEAHKPPPEEEDTTGGSETDKVWDVPKTREEILEEKREAANRQRYPNRLTP